MVKTFVFPISCCRVEMFPSSPFSSPFNWEEKGPVLLLVANKLDPGRSQKLSGRDWLIISENYEGKRNTHQHELQSKIVLFGMQTSEHQLLDCFLGIIAVSNYSRKKVTTVFQNWINQHLILIDKEKFKKKVNTKSILKYSYLNHNDTETRGEYN